MNGLQYPESFKLEVAEYSRVLGQRTTARLFSISQRRIFDWLIINDSTTGIASQDSEIKCTASGSIISAPDNNGRSILTSGTTTSKEEGSSKELSLRSRKQLLDFDVEKEVYDWVKQRFPQHVSSTEIREKAKELYLAKGHQSMKCSYGWYRRWQARFKLTKNPHDDTDPLILTWLLQRYDENHIVSYTDVQSYAQKTLSTIKPDFKASAGWATRFLKRHHVLINWDGIYEGSLPLHLEDAVEKFRKTFQESVALPYLPEKNGSIGCMDEIPLSFSGTYNPDDHYGGFSRHNVSRVKRFSVRNCEATVLLALMADGCLLPPFVIMKAQDSTTIDQVYSKPDSPVVVFYCQSTEPSIKSLKKWLELIWSKAVYISTHNVLLLDSYSLHKSLIEKCKSLETSLELFPLGCSCKLNPIHYLARRCFLKCMEDFWMNHVKNGSSEARVQLPSTDRIVEWVTASYMAVREQKTALSDSFRKVKLVLPNDDSLHQPSTSTSTKAT